MATDMPMMRERRRGSRHLPSEPLRRALERAYPHLHDNTQGPNLRTIAGQAGLTARTIQRIFEHDIISYRLADKVCCRALGVHPHNVFGDEWFLFADICKRCGEYEIEHECFLCGTQLCSECWDGAHFDPEIELCGHCWGYLGDNPGHQHHN